MKFGKANPTTCKVAYKRDKALMEDPKMKKPYLCVHCERWFKKNGLIDHNVIKHNWDFDCGDCLNRFLTSVDLDLHEAGSSSVGLEGGLKGSESLGLEGGLKGSESLGLEGGLKTKMGAQMDEVEPMLKYAKPVQVKSHLDKMNLDGDMTLAEYESLLAEKRKLLPPKVEERVVENRFVGLTPLFNKKATSVEDIKPVAVAVAAAAAAAAARRPNPKKRMSLGEFLDM